MTIRVLSLGAGVQSTTMALMAARGALLPMPDCAIFADTQDEPRAVYEHLSWLRSPGVLPFPVHVTTSGKLSERLRAGDKTADIPCFIAKGGMVQRRCTRNFKLRAINRKLRDVLGLDRRSYVGPGAIELWIGISTDEAARAKPSGFRYIINRHPLIEQFMSRADCKAWLRTNGYQEPAKSSCVFCPYQGNKGWRTRRDVPDEWAEVVALDEWFRLPEQVARFHGELFLHHSCRPLASADLDEPEFPLFGNLFDNECEGMCGV